MRACNAFVIAAAGVIAMSAAAHAADPPGSWLPDIIKPVATELISGWYARADLGWRKQKFDSVEPATLPMTQWSLEDAVTFGGGGGYKYKWFRMDGTVDYATAVKFRGDTAATPGYYGAKIDSFTLLANVYLDLGNWSGFTPYIGAGVGTSNVRTHQFVTGVLMAPPDGIKDNSRWNLSWATMAGISYRFTPNLLVDVSYRYLKLGDAVSGPEPPLYTTPNNLRDLSAQEIRVGLRWMLD